MSEERKKQVRCSKCVFRAESTKPWKCNYEGVTRHTRKGQPPEKCTYFKEGGRLPDKHSGTETLRLDRIVREGNEVQKKGSARHDWVKGRLLYDQGKTDREIGEAIGCGKNTVTTWRRRNKLKANVAQGYYDRAKKTKAPMMLDDVMQKLQEAAEKRGASKVLTGQAVEAISILVDRVRYLEEKLEQTAGR